MNKVEKNSKFLKIDIELVKRLYWDDSKSMKEIADIIGCSVGKIHKEFIRNSIPARPRYKGMLGKKHSKKVCEIISKCHKNKKISDETKKKISDANTKGGIGHKKKRNDGYIYVYFPDHPYSTKDGYVMEHILVAECLLGRWLKDNECVHHINGKRDDNRKQNLLVMTKKEHMSLHSKRRWAEWRLKHAQ